MTTRRVANTGFRLSFHGGAGTVTGSKFLLETSGTRLLIDCGLFQGLKQLRLLNWQPLPFDPGSLDAVLLTHAHIDHSGFLPRLVRQGFRGPIYCTPATRELAEILLMDAARLQEEDAEYANRKGFSKHHPALPLFTQDDAQLAINQLRPRKTGSAFRVGGAGVRFFGAGHILGAAFVRIEAAEAGGRHAIVFSGDLGRFGAPLHLDPEALPTCDTLVLESTYGDQLHSHKSMADQIGPAFRETFSRGGIVLIPAFAVARSQLLMLLLREMMEAGDIPETPIHLDSPMAADVTDIYRRYLRDGELERLERGFMPRSLRLHRTVDESRQLNDLRGPRIIISASGMLTGGRVLHHLRRLAPENKNLLVLSGYQAAGTRGRALLEGARTLRVHGEDVPVKAGVIQVEGLSAHADAADLVRWLHSGARKPASVFLTHGEAEALQALRTRLQGQRMDVFIPELGQTYALAETGRWSPPATKASS